MTDDFSSANVKALQVMVDFVVKIPIFLRLSVLVLSAVRPN